MATTNVTISSTWTKVVDSTDAEFLVTCSARPLSVWLD